MHNDETGQAGL